MNTDFLVLIIILKFTIERKVSLYKVKSEKIILGIDPGTLKLGYGLLKVQGNKLSNICMGEIRLNKLENQQLKLLKIYERVKALILEYKPDECAVESPFYGQNVQSMLKLGRAQGVVMVASLSLDIPVMEYAPRKIKQSITGNGNASKEQVAQMIKTLCNMKTVPTSLDATDAMSAAICHHFQTSNGISSDKKFKDWKSFISENQKRVK